MKKLAESIDALAEKDEKLLQETRQIEELRRRAASDLHAICSRFVGEINGLVSKTPVEFTPAEYSPETFQEEGLNLLQINARGRIVQIEFEATDQLTSNESFRTPYILEGAIRCFNQELLDRSLIEAQSLFYCLEKKQNTWRFFDARTHRTGVFDQDYLIALMEQLV